MALLLSALNTAAAEPPPEPEHEFTFVVLGDSQFHLPNKFNQIIDEVVHLFPAFVIQVGDMIKGYTSDLDVFRAEWVRFQAQIAPLERGGIPFMPVPGNHDLLDADRKPGGEGVYREIWGETHYSWDYNNAHFIVLNTDDGKGSEIVGDQLAWLKQDLATANGSEHIFVFMHRPIYTLGNEEELHQIFVDHDVSAVICGHMHHYNFQERDGISYIMTVSATHMGTPFPMAAGSFHHMLLITVRDSTFRVAVIEAGHIFPTDIVAFEDNQGLYQLQIGFYSQARMAFGDLERDENRYEVTLRVNNPSEQELTTYFEWQLPNERWSVEPLRGRRVVLTPRSLDVRGIFESRGWVVEGQKKRAYPY